jgi:hypothetical protein
VTTTSTIAEQVAGYHGTEPGQVLQAVTETIA